MKKTAVVIDMANVKRTQEKITHLVCAAVYSRRPRPCPRCCVTPIKSGDAALTATRSVSTASSVMEDADGNLFVSVTFARYDQTN